jgi:signal transduction histidine kinase
MKTEWAHGGPPVKLVYVGVAATLALILGLGVIVLQSHASVKALAETELKVRWVAGEVMRLDEVLTMSARMAATTGDRRWEERYFRHEPELDARLKEMASMLPETFGTNAAAATEQTNIRLVEAERLALTLAREGRTDEAIAQLHGSEYEGLKALYTEEMAALNAQLEKRADAQLSAHRQTMWAGFSVGGLLSLVLGMVWVRIAQAIARHYDAARRAGHALQVANHTLEERVEQRTQELCAANLDLRKEMDRRLQTEAELRQAQKLESVGRLASGVAHEINTPVQFVSDSLHFVRDATQDLLGVVGQLRELKRAIAGGQPTAEAVAAADEAEEAADLKYVCEHLPKAIERSLEGLGRVTSIVLSMKEFAHPDAAEKVAVDLNRAIKSTLSIARNEYKYVADLETDFGELPAVKCHLGEFNQVILNIVINAAHAIEDQVRGSERRGLIGVRTRRDGAHALISISDTGGGIPDDIGGHIFDPFFTTKEVGRGTGQGLAIARSVVVEKHGGSLHFETRVGEGTTFHIRLPIAECDALSQGAAA